MQRCKVSIFLFPEETFIATSKFLLGEQDTNMFSSSAIRKFTTKSNQLSPPVRKCKDF